MKYLKIIFTIVSLTALLYIIHFVSSIFFMDVYQYYEGRGFEIEFQFFFSFFIEFLLVTGMLFGLVGLFRVLKNGHFQIKAKKMFVFSATTLLLAGLLDFSYCVFAIDNFDKVGDFFQRIATNFILIILALVIYSIASFVEKGFLLKQENDLTI